MNKLDEQISRFFDGYAQERYLLACSGGVDSMVLFELLTRQGITFEAAHIDYRLRGAESDKDRFFVEAHCEKHRVQCHVYRVSDAERASLQNGNLQEKARNIRYAYFKKLLEKQQLRAVLTAHHADDQIETFFMHIARKSGLAGLSAMWPRQEQLWRPLLNIRKSEILAFAVQRQVPYREDRSNEGTGYARNRLRNVIIPFLKARDAFPDDAILLLADRFRETHANVSLNVSATVKRFLKSGVLAFSDFDRLEEVEQVELLRQLGWKSQTLEELRKLRRSKHSGTYTFVPFNGRKHKLFRVDQAFMIERETAFKTLVTESCPELPETFDPHTAYLDERRLNGALHVRSRHTGDRMTPVGMQGSKLISAILKDAKVPVAERAAIPVVCDAEKIVWLPGYRVSAEAAATENGPHVICARLE